MIPDQPAQSYYSRIECSESVGAPSECSGIPVPVGIRDDKSAHQGSMGVIPRWQATYNGLGPWWLALGVESPQGVAEAAGVVGSVGLVGFVRLLPCLGSGSEFGPWSLMGL